MKVFFWSRYADTFILLGVKYITMSVESMSSFNISYKVCPYCGNPLQLINGTLVCRICGHVILGHEEIAVV